MLLCAVLIVVFNHRACFCPGSRYVCARLCVSAPRAIKAIDAWITNLTSPTAFQFLIRHWLSILSMGGALVTNRVVSYCQRGARLRGICCSLCGKIRLTSCTLLTRWSASVLKVGVPCGLRSLQNKTGL